MLALYAFCGEDVFSNGGSLPAERTASDAAMTCQSASQVAGLSFTKIIAPSVRLYQA
jgi:hypothetical protein